MTKNKWLSHSELTIREEWISAIITGLANTPNSSDTIVINFSHILSGYKKEHKTITDIRLDSSFQYQWGTDYVFVNATKNLLQDVSATQDAMKNWGGHVFVFAKDSDVYSYYEQSEDTTFAKKYPSFDVYNKLYWAAIKLNTRETFNTWISTHQNFDVVMGMEDINDTQISFMVRDIMVYLSCSRVGEDYWIAWTKNNTLKNISEEADQGIPISIPKENSPEIKNRNEDSVLSKESRFEDVPIGLHIIQLSAYPSIINRQVNLSNSDIETETTIQFTLSYPSGKREEKYSGSLDKKLKSPKWEVKITCPYWAMEIRQYGSFSDYGEGAVVVKKNTKKEILLEINREKFNRNEAFDREIHIQHWIEIITGSSSLEWYDLYETTHNWAPIPKENKVTKDYPSYWRIISWKPYHIIAHDKPWYEVENIVIGDGYSEYDLKNSYTINGKEWIVNVEFDRNPGSLYVNINYKKLVVKNISNTSKTKLLSNVVTYVWDTTLKIQEISKTNYDKLSSVEPNVLYITKI